MEKKKWEVPKFEELEIEETEQGDYPYASEKEMRDNPDLMNSDYASAKS